MRVSYRVHRVSDHQVEREVQVDGEKMKALVDMVEVELVPVSHGLAGTVKLAFTGKDATEAKETFSRNGTVLADFTQIGEE